MREKGHAMASIQTPGRKAATLAGTLLLAGCCFMLGFAPVESVEHTRPVVKATSIPASTILSKVA